MKPVLIACTDKREVQKINDVIAQEYTVAVIESSDKLKPLVNESAMVILDHGFYRKCGFELFRALLEHPAPPFLMLAPPDDTRTIIESMEIGMHYVPKLPYYQKLLGLTISRVLSQIQEQESLKQTARHLERRVKELEATLSTQIHVSDEASSPAISPDEEKRPILDEIIFVFKRGEIELPTLPQMGIKFQEMMTNGANLHDIGELLKQDMAISSRLISVSNSAYYRGVAKSKNLGQAIGRLGLRNTKRYVDAICNRTLYATKNKRYLTFLEKLWEHSLACGYASQILDESLALGLENDAFTMGLLHDIGKLLLLQVIGELQMQKKIGDEVETSELLGTVNTHHAKFGAALLRKWKFSETFGSIASYHNNLAGAGSVSTDLWVVHFANLMVKSMGYALTDPDGVRQKKIDLEHTESARHLGLEAPMIDEFKNKVSVFMNEFKGLFG